MRDDVREAIEAVHTADYDTQPSGGRRGHSFEKLRHLLFRLVQALPDDMTIRELREEIEG